MLRKPTILKDKIILQPKKDFNEEKKHLGIYFFSVINKYIEGLDSDNLSLLKNLTLFYDASLD